MSDVQQAFRNLAETQSRLEETALRIKSQRDEAMAILREVLTWHTVGNAGGLEMRIRRFLKSVA